MKILVSAGEVSGDVHGSYLVRELKKLRPDVYFYGMGSEKLAAEGVNVKFNISNRGTIGIFEALPNVIPIYLTFIKMKRLLLKEKPDLVLLVDSQGFNMPFAKFCKSVGVKTVYYIAPQEWLWGTLRGVKKVAETVDLIVAIFQKEYEAYKKAGANVVYFGHPLLDIVTSHGARVTGQICLCPGSRTQEIKGLLPIFLEAAELIQKEMPCVSFVIPAASKEVGALIRPIIFGNRKSKIENRKLDVVQGNVHKALSSSDLAICASGTINLEASLLGVPNIMVYKLSPLTYWVGKHILKIGEKLKYFSMPNILLDRELIPEFIQENARPEKIADAAIKMLKDKRRMDDAELLKKLGMPPVISKIAEAVLAFAKS